MNEKECIKSLLERAKVAEARAEKAEKERDKAIEAIFQWVGCPECKRWNGTDEWCEKHDRYADSMDGCSSPEWKGLLEEE